MILPSHPSLKILHINIEDIRMTREAAEAGQLLGVDVLDHIVVAKGGFISLRENGLYTPTRTPTVH